MDVFKCYVTDSIDMLIVFFLHFCDQQSKTKNKNKTNKQTKLKNISKKFQHKMKTEEMSIIV